MNKSKILDGEVGKSILGSLKKYNPEINEDNLSKYVIIKPVKFIKTR